MRKLRLWMRNSASPLARRSPLTSRLGLFFGSISPSNRRTPSVWSWSLPGRGHSFRVRRRNGCKIYKSNWDTWFYFRLSNFSRKSGQMLNKFLPDIVLEVSVRMKWEDFLKHRALSLACRRYSVMSIPTVTTSIAAVVGPNLDKADVPFPSGSGVLPSFPLKCTLGMEVAVSSRP